jgi:hypothetical protein
VENQDAEMLLGFIEKLFSASMMKDILDDADTLEITRRLRKTTGILPLDRHQILELIFALISFQDRNFAFE